MARPPKAILFDTFGTVVDWRGSLIAELTAFGAQRGLAANWPGLVDAWRGAYAPSMARVRRGEQPWTRLDDLHRASLDALCPRFGLQDLPEADRAWMTLGWHRLSPWPDSVAGLRRLRGMAIIAPLSNGNVSLLVDLARFGGLPWDLVFGADLFGHYKPDAETYLGACRLLDLPPDQVMMAAAHNGDLRAARALGLQTGFLSRPTEYGPGQTTDLGPEQDWDIIATDLEAMATLLGV
jgi:2-haloacid dehalogenase